MFMLTLAGQSYFKFQLMSIRKNKLYIWASLNCYSENILFNEEIKDDYCFPINQVYAFILKVQVAKYVPGFNGNKKNCTDVVCNDPRWHRGKQRFSYLKCKLSD